MALSNIFDALRTKRVALLASQDGQERPLIVVDCMRAEELSLEAQATLHEIEDGSEIADHVILKGRTLQLEGIISDTPINLTRSAIGAAAGGIGGAMGGVLGSVVTAATVVMANLAMEPAQKPSKAALDIFEAIYAQRTLLTIVSGLSTYTGMVMEKFIAPRTARTAGALEFKASFRQVSIVAGRTVSVPKEQAVKNLSAPEQQNGRQQGAVLDEAKSSRAASWAYRLIWGDN